MIRQTLNGGLAESSQLVWFPKRLSYITQLLANARTSRSGKILGCLYTIDANHFAGVNGQRTPIGKNETVEGYARSPGRSQIAPEESPSSLIQRRSRDGRDVSLDGHALRNSEGGSDIYRLH
jgi:hypothetical protein